MKKIFFNISVAVTAIFASQGATAALYRYSQVQYPASIYDATSLEVNQKGEFATYLIGATSFAGNYIWTAKGNAVKLQMPDDHTGGQVIALNDRGTSVGTTFDATTGNVVSRATAWYGTTPVLLPELGVNRGEVALDVNNNGEIVGYSRSLETGFKNALLWDKDGLHDLGNGGGLSAVASAINDIGTIVGATRFEDGSQGTIWQNGTVTHIGTLGGTQSVLADVNYLGWAVGDSLLEGNENWRAILWDGIRVHNLGTLGGQWSSANNIGDDGTVFGSSLTYSGKQHATIWRDDSIIDLLDLIDNPSDLGSLQMMTAIGSDAYGNIYGITYDKTTYSEGTFVLTPFKETDIPEPATIALFTIGTIYLLTRSAERKKKQ